jgi:hypothetical protein
MKRAELNKRLGSLLLSGLLVGCATAGPEGAIEVPGQADVAEEIAAPADAESLSDTEDAADQDSEDSQASSDSSPAQSAATDWPDNWQDMPVVPEISDAMREVYQRGLEMGNDPHAFSVVGDCQNVSVYFLGDFDETGQYSLGEYDYLQATIDQYSGSFSRERVAANGGFSVATVLSPLWGDPELCEPSESPLECEFRLSNPSVVFISMETWWYDRPADTYAGYLRQIVEYSIDEGVVPIIATKADNLEGDHRINAAIVSVAQEYDVPLWNFWAAVQPLPGHGLTEDAFHLAYARPFFDDDVIMEHSWPIRNLTALQSLDAVWHGVSDVEVANN